jgi:hypothetical protein
LRVSGDAAIAFNLNLNFSPNFSIAPGDAFKLIDIGGVRSGTFVNRSEGSTVGTFNGVPLFLTYLGGNGNDITLYSVPTGQVPAASAGPNQNAYFVGSNPGGSGNATYTYQNLNVLGGSSYTLGSGETLNLNNGAGTLTIGTGSVFTGNGTVNGSIVNNGLLIIPITRAGVINQTSGGVVNIAPPTIPPPGGIPTTITPPPQTNIGGGTYVVIGGSGIGGGSGGGGGGGGGGYYSWGTSGSNTSITSEGSLGWDGQLDVTGSFTQTDTGILRLFIAGEDKGETYSHLAIGMQATIDGSLQIVLQPELFNYVPEVGDSFDFVTAAGGITIAPDDIQLDAFITVEGAEFLNLPTSALTRYNSPFSADPNRLYELDSFVFDYELVDGGKTLRATLVSGVFIPEPSSVALLALPALGLRRARTRR